MLQIVKKNRYPETSTKLDDLLNPLFVRNQTEGFVRKARTYFSSLEEHLFYAIEDELDCQRQKNQPHYPYHYVNPGFPQFAEKKV